MKERQAWMEPQENRSITAKKCQKVKVITKKDLEDQFGSFNFCNLFNLGFSSDKFHFSILRKRKMLLNFPRLSASPINRIKLKPGPLDFFDRIHALQDSRTSPHSGRRPQNREILTLQRRHSRFTEIDIYEAQKLIFRLKSEKRLFRVNQNLKKIQFFGVGVKVRTSEKTAVVFVEDDNGSVVGSSQGLLKITKSYTLDKGGAMEERGPEQLPQLAIERFWGPRNKKLLIKTLRERQKKQLIEIDDFEKMLTKYLDLTPNGRLEGSHKGFDYNREALVSHLAYTECYGGCFNFSVRDILAKRTGVEHEYRCRKFKDYFENLLGGVNLGEMAPVEFSLTPKILNKIYVVKGKESGEEVLQVVLVHRERKKICLLVLKRLKSGNQIEVIFSWIKHFERKIWAMTASEDSPDLLRINFEQSAGEAPDNPLPSETGFHVCYYTELSSMLRAGRAIRLSSITSGIQTVSHVEKLPGGDKLGLSVVYTAKLSGSGDRGEQIYERIEEELDFGEAEAFSI